jgi:S-adenosylmethionine decarboxylase
MTFSLTGFEGAEKCLELEFYKPASDRRGLCVIGRTQWDALLQFASCTIISNTSNDHFDSYVLSESSLFVYPNKIIIKTCGTTTLLRLVPELLSIARKRNMSPRFVLYRRKNFLFPSEQLAPHTSFESEVAFLNTIFDGDSYTFGPTRGDHWNLYVADLSLPDDKVPADQTLEIMMHDIDPDVLKQFYRGSDFVSARDMTIRAGIDALLPGSTIDEFAFTPCGYSMNGLLDKAYWTIHITPEEHCSYVSFETNVTMGDYTALVQQVFDTFKPGRAIVALFADTNAPCSRYDCMPACDLSQVPGLRRKSHTLSTLEGNNNLWLSCYVRADAISPRCCKMLVNPISSCASETLRFEEDELQAQLIFDDE